MTKIRKVHDHSNRDYESSSVRAFQRMLKGERSWQHKSYRKCIGAWGFLFLFVFCPLVVLWCLLVPRSPTDFYKGSISKNTLQISLKAANLCSLVDALCFNPWREGERNPGWKKDTPYSPKASSLPVCWLITLKTNLKDWSLIFFNVCFGSVLGGVWRRYLVGVWRYVGGILVCV